MSADDVPVTRPAGVSHVRLTVTDIARSKAFYEHLLGEAPAVDYSGQADDPAVRADPERLYGGCAFEIGDSLVGLRPAAPAGDRFESTRVGLDHLSLLVPSMDDLRTAADRLDEAGVEHGQIKELADLGIAILSLQDPDDINLELSAKLSG